MKNRCCVFTSIAIYLFRQPTQGFHVHTNQRKKIEELHKVNGNLISLIPRRKWLTRSVQSLFVSYHVLVTDCRKALAGEQVTAEELDAIYEEERLAGKQLPPQAPEERSGLVVLRVAEVADFQEKILRAIADGSLRGVKVAPMQFQFGTQILLKNSNIQGNMKLMIDKEIPRGKRPEAARCAARAMNQLQEILQYSASIQRDFETEEMVRLADMYLTVRVNLNELYEFLPPPEKAKYYGYFAAVTAYEKKIAEGVYNPDIDGVLKFD